MESQWRSLPPEILTTIAGRLNSHFSLLHLRSVCSSWRSSLPLSLSPTSPFPLTLPPLSDSVFHVHPSPPSPLAVVRSTVLRLSPLSSPSPSSPPWLLKLSLTKNPNTFSLLNPLTTTKIKKSATNFDKSINFLDFRVEEIADSFHLEYLPPAADEESPVFVKKVVVLPDMTVLILSYGGRLEKWRPGDQSWTPVSGNNDGKRDSYPHFQDVILVNNECYAVTVSGILVRFGIDFNQVDLTCSMGWSPGERKYLVPSSNGDDLYMISKFSDPDPELYYDYMEDEYVVDVDTIDMPIRMRGSELNRKWGYWDYVGRKGDEVFFLGDDVSFMFSAKDFDGCRADSIYLTDEYFWQDDDEDNVYGQDTGLYALDERLVVRLAAFPKYAKLFWPPPSWVMEGSSSSGS